MDRPRAGAGDGVPGPGEPAPGPSSSPPHSVPPSAAGADPPAGPPAGRSGIGRDDLYAAGAAPPEEIIGVARAVFGDRLALAVAYAELLVTDGVVRGLVGPREAPRIWERHLINCAVMSEMIPKGASVADVGSGAGLPGIVLAVARPDLSITLVEPLARRTAFLSETVGALGLDSLVTVVRGRAEDLLGTLPPVDVVTARAVAPLDRLAGWCLPLAAVGGRLLALTGASASDEVVEHRAAVHRLGGSDPVVRLCGAGTIDPPTTVVEIVRERGVVPSASRPSKRAAGSGRSASGAVTGRRRPRRG
jgi:16S rRNA (guanine527-N7)-methyltransferase